MTRRPHEKIDTASATWDGVKEWGEAQLERSRSTLEAPGTSPIDTEYQRGRVAALRDLLALPRRSELDQPNEPQE
ncbi:hypothetical protein [Fodinicurvata sediminis]|uniref:hypothetical protein n=1 Tax=Fodinicurvata sediminis TaxID=1121832 RepID=UPI0003B38479|nr:hypothetical protein [Fodinicurvata sediminis]